MSVAFDSGWVNITDKYGEYFNVTHNLNSTDLVVDIQGKAAIDGVAHRKYYDPANARGWNRTFEGGLEPCVMVQTSDGGYALAGFSFEGTCLVKTDYLGNVQWKKTYDENLDPHDIVQTSDGGYAIASYWFTLIKTDNFGNMLWKKNYTTINSASSATDMIMTDDGGYALAGYYWSDENNYNSLIVKTDSLGNMQWNQTYGIANDNYANTIVETSEGGYAITVQENSFGAGGFDTCLIKTDYLGNMQWNKTYGEAGDDVAYSMILTSDGGYALAGLENSFGAGGHDFWLVKIDASGNMQWNKTYGGTSKDQADTLVQTVDGGYALAGSTTSFGYAFLLVKTDSESGLAWVDSTANTIMLYRGITDIYWNYVRVRLWKPQ